MARRSGVLLRRMALLSAVGQSIGAAMLLRLLCLLSRMMLLLELLLLQILLVSHPLLLLQAHEQRLCPQVVWIRLRNALLFHLVEFL